MYQEYSSSKHKLNRSELPSIHRGKQSATTSMRTKHQNSHYNEIVDSHREYDEMTNEQIKLESKRLKTQIIQINRQINNILQKEYLWRIKSLEKKNLTKEEQEVIIEKEAQNNKKILELYTRELGQLEDRKKMIKFGAKNSTLSEIMETEENILNMKMYLKETKKKVHTKQKQIVEVCDEKRILRNANELKELQQQYNNTQSKYSQMKLRLEDVYSKNQRLKMQNQMCSQEYKKAEEVIRQINAKYQKWAQESELEFYYNSKKQQLEAARKKLENVRSNGQQKYLSRLKELDRVTALNENFGSKQMDKKVQQSREMIRGLQEILLQQQAEISSQIRQLQAPKRLSIQLQSQENETWRSVPHQKDKQQHVQQQCGQQINHELQQMQIPREQQEMKQLQISPVKGVAKEQPQQYNPNSLFLTLAQSSKQETVYKTPIKRMQSEDVGSIQSKKTISLRSIEQQQKSKQMQKQITSIVTEANDAVRSVKNLLKSIEQNHVSANEGSPQV